MRIEILGMGCARCNTLEGQVREALKDLKVEAEVEKVADLDRISSYGVLMTPGLVIDGKVYSTGKIPKMSELKSWIMEKATKDED
jgi:small redox-active disulfide protein 2